MTKEQSTTDITPAEVEEAFTHGMSLEDALDFDFAGWKPEPGAKLTGTVVYVTRTDGGHPEFEANSADGKYPLVAVITTDGELVSIHAFHSALRNAIEGQAPQAGDTIGVKYKGWKIKSGRDPKSKATMDGYEDYNVIVQHAAALPAAAVPAALPA